MINKIIKMSQIVRISNLYLEIFEEEDNIYPDFRVIRPKERAIDRVLESITTDKEEQRKIYTAITEKHFFAETYKPICDELRKLRYTVIEGI